jgi:H+/gluconate symporter-like permease
MTSNYWENAKKETNALLITLVIQVSLACMDRIVKFVKKNHKQKANHAMTFNYRDNAAKETNALLITLVIQVLLACMDRIVNLLKKTLS